MGRVITLLDSVSGLQSSSPVHVQFFPAQFHVFLSSNADASATVVIEASSENDPGHWFPVLTFVLSGANETAGRSVACEYCWFRARLASISGSGTSVSANINASFR